MTLQLQHPAQDQTLAPTAQQSLNLVRNLLGTALGAIAYLRGLFPEDHFKDSSMGGLALKTLVRDMSFEGDELLNWLESGCYHALEQQYLKTMIFGIYLDPAEPEKLVEAYTFGFSYPDKDQWCITIDTNGKDVFRLRTRAAIMKATSDMLRRLLILTQTLRPIPDNAYITMKFFYYDDVTPLDYEPPYFRAGNDADKFYFVHQPERINTGLVETPYHALNMHVQTAAEGMQPIQEDIDEETCDVPVSSASNDAQESGGFVMKDDEHSGAGFNDSDVTCIEVGQLDGSQVLDVTAQMDQLGLNVAVTEQEKAPETETESDTVPLDGDVGTNIISTMPQGPMHSSDNTQDLVHHLKTGIQVHTMANFTNVDDPDEEKFGGASLSPSGSCMTRSSSIDLTIEELLKADGNISEEVRNAPLVNKGAELNRSIESVKVGIVMPEAGAVKLEGKSRYGALLGQGEDGEPIDCPCGVNEEDGDMIFCARCKAWGHLACAGYRKATDKRIAKTHLCYACQNETGTGDMVYDLEYVAEVALFRRGIHVAFTDGITSISEFASGLGVGLPQAKQILGRLVKEGFVAEAKSGKGKKKSGPQYQVLKTSAAGGRHSKWFSKAPFTEYAARKEKLQAMRGSSVAKHSSHTHLSEQLSGRNTPLPDPQLLNTVDTGHRDVTPDADSTQQIITRAKSRSASVASTAFTQSGLFVNRTPVSKTSGQLPTPLAKPPTAAKIDDIVENTESIRHQFLQQSTDRQMTGFALNKTTDDATRGDVFTSKRAAPEENIKTLEAKRRKVSVVTKPLSVL